MNCTSWQTCWRQHIQSVCLKGTIKFEQQLCWHRFFEDRLKSQCRVLDRCHWSHRVVLVVSPCGALVRDVHEAHVAVLGGPGVVVAVVPEAGQTGLLHAGLLPQQGASGGGGDSSGSAPHSGARTCRTNQHIETETRSNRDAGTPEVFVLVPELY